MNLRKQWRELQQGRPGHRFIDQYERVRRSARDYGLCRRMVFLIAGLISLAIALVLSVIPGPAIPFYFLAGALLAVQSRALSRLMDWMELRVRQLARWARRIWRQLPAGARVLLLAIGMSASAGSAYVMYRLLS
jgi:hypothetical protein